MSGSAAHEWAVDEVVRAAITTGKLRAENLVDRLTNLPMRDRLRVEIAAMAATCGRLDLAETVIDRIQDGEQHG